MKASGPANCWSRESCQQWAWLSPACLASSSAPAPPTAVSSSPGWSDGCSATCSPVACWKE